MSISGLKRQYITDEEGTPIGVILPIDEYLMIKRKLSIESNTEELAQKLDQLSNASFDALFMADLHETMESYRMVDYEWWEHES